MFKHFPSLQSHPLFQPIPLTMVGTIIGMSFYEVAKDELFPQLPEWLSHLVTIIFVCAGAYGVLQVVHRRHQELVNDLNEAEHRAQRQTNDLIKTHAALQYQHLKSEEEKSNLKRLSHEHELILSAVDEGLFGLDLNGCITFVNPAAAKMLGYSMKVLIGQPVHDLIHSGDLVPHEREQCPIYGAFKDRVIHGLEGEVFWRKDGSAFPVEFVCTPMVEMGMPAGAVVSFHDITRRKQVEDDFRKVSASARCILWMAEVIERDWGLDWNLRITDEMAAQQVLPVDLQPGQSYTALWYANRDPEDEARMNEISTQALLSGKNGYSQEFRCYNRYGNIQWLHEEVTILADTPGRWQVIGLCTDVTQRRLAELSIQELNQKLESILQSCPLSLIALDKDAQITMWNPAAEQTFGWQKEDVLGMPLPIVPTEPWQDSRGPFQSQLMGDSIRSREVRCWKKDGSLIEVSLSTAPLFNAEGEVIGGIGAFADITDRKRLEETLRESHDRLADALIERQFLVDDLEKTLNELQQTQQQIIEQERLSALGRMASGIAHDFNNTLVPILGLSDLMLTRPDILADTSKSTRYLKLIHTAAQDAANVVNNLREFYRPREEKESFQSVELNEVVEQTVQLTQPKWKDQTYMNGVTIEIVTEMEAVPPVLGNEANLREVLTNLIFNAVDAMPQGGRIALRTYVTGDQVTVEVADTGMGMPKEVRERCLEPFFTTKGARGTGLGLAMVYGIVQRHGGMLDIQSLPGQGTTISFRLPVFLSSPTTVIEVHPETDTRLLTLLVVDDEPLVREVVSECLESEGHTVHTAENGFQALELFEPGKYDLVMTDRSMPGMSGDQLAVSIKQRAPRQPLLMMTGFGEFMDAAGEHPEGVDVVLGKPVRLQELHAAMAQAFEIYSGGSEEREPETRALALTEA